MIYKKDNRQIFTFKRMFKDNHYPLRFVSVMKIQNKLFKTTKLKLYVNCIVNDNDHIYIEREEVSRVWKQNLSWEVESYPGASRGQVKTENNPTTFKLYRGSERGNCKKKNNRGLNLFLKGKISMNFRADMKY